jgi:diguanylate cyclase (GGDEF)-like protein
MTLNGRSLPGKIVSLIIGTVLIFLLTLCVSLTWMGRALDEKAYSSDLAQVENARDGLLAQMRVLMLDYAKWEAAVPLVQAENLSWINDNIGASAVTGFAFQLAVLWGGPFEEDLGWQERGTAQPATGSVDGALLGQVEAQLRRIPLNLYRGTEFFAWHEGSLYVIGAARFEPDAPSAIADLISRDTRTPRLLLGRRLSGRIISELGETHLIEALHVVREARRDQPSLPLAGGDGQPVAYLVWETERAGTNVLWRMVLPLSLVVSLATVLAIAGAILVRRGAKQLVYAELRASAAALTDALTGLPNRAAFNNVISAPSRAGERAVLFLDVNGFKRINDSIGHAAGDEVIRCLAQRFAALAATDCPLARIAGDEFVFVVLGANAGFRTEWLAEAVGRTLARQFSVLGHQMRISAAMGYAVQESDDTTGDDLVRQADLAMYEAKRQKSVSAVAFSAVIEQASRDAAVIEQGLRQALEHEDELSVVYQPILDMNGRMVRAEALARWTSLELGPVSPDRFIAVAEQAGLIIELGRRFFRVICDDLQAHPALNVSLNVSPLQLMAPDYIPGLIRELKERGIGAWRVEVELTEAVVVDDHQMAMQRLEELRDAGFSTALDDFGTGYSSLGYLRQLRFDTLKIDRSLVSGFDRRPEGLAMLGALLVLSHSMDLRVVCEGVETADELRLLRTIGCDLVQGFLLDQPMTVAALSERWLKAQDLDVQVPCRSALGSARDSAADDTQRISVSQEVEECWVRWRTAEASRSPSLVPAVLHRGALGAEVAHALNSDNSPLA